MGFAKRDSDTVQAGSLPVAVTGALRVRKPMDPKTGKEGMDQVLHSGLGSVAGGRKVVVKITRYQQ